MKRSTIAIVALGLFACSGGDFDQITERTRSTPQAFVDGKGRRWIPVGQIENYAPEPSSGEIMTTDRRSASAPKKFEEMTERELAVALAPKAMSGDGHEYRLESLDLDLARKIRAHMADPKEVLTAPGGEQPSVGDVAKMVLPPSDARFPIRANTTFPASAQVLITNSSTTSACSATMIARSTAISAAHCFHSGSGWFSVRDWAPGVDSQDGAAAFPFGRANGCYWVTIPGCWDSDKDNRCDYAVIEFAGGFPNCNLNPGDSTSWFLWGTQTNAQIQSATWTASGYPSGTGKDCGVSGVCPGGTCNFPQQWRATGSALVWDSDEQHSLSHHIDTSGGQSGTALYNSAEGFRKVVGIHQGCYTSSAVKTNRARRIDGTVWNFIFQYSAL